jgi:hypothetical protein
VFDFISKRLNKHCRFKACILFLLFSIYLSPSFSTANPCSICLTVRNLISNQILYKKPIKPGDTFTYAYTHSAEKLPVYETFVIDKNLDIVLTETKLKSLSVLGYILAPGEKLILTKENVIIKSKRSFKSLSLRVAYFYKQKIIFPDDEIELQQLAEQGDPIEIKINRDCQ